ncbi:MAG TPA: 50S ribosomal protein L5 [Candidatus Paceibacterota bacterium]|nr:50S ribosomal protein L5 [Candidatus Paceibacterota bacterium]
MQSVKEKQNKTYEAMKGDFEYKNPFQSPRLVKVVVSTGTGSSKDRNKNDFVMDRLAKITGQKPTLRSAKKSIASFKLREGDPIGVTVTLRGNAMMKFIDKLLNVALPRTKDFRGLSKKSIDHMGNYTMGIREHTVFTETSDEELKDVFGLSITFVTTAENSKEAEAFLTHLGLPFHEEVIAKKK